jgi:hypothetical protein
LLFLQLDVLSFLFSLCLCGSFFPAVLREFVAAEAALSSCTEKGRPHSSKTGAPSAALVHASKEEIVKRLLLRLAVGLIGLAVVAKGMAQPPPPWSVLTDLGATAEQRAKFNRSAPRLIEQALKDQRKQLLIREAALAEPQPTGRIAEELELWFLGKDAGTREAVLAGVTKLLDLNAKAQLRLARGESVFVPNDDTGTGVFWAHVDPRSKEQFYLGKVFFAAARNGQESQAGILTYVMAHSVGLTSPDRGLVGKKPPRPLELSRSAKERLVSPEVWQYFVESANWAKSDRQDPEVPAWALKGSASIEVKPWSSMLPATASDKDKASFDATATDTIRQALKDELKMLRDGLSSMDRWDDDPSIRDRFSDYFLGTDAGNRIRVENGIKTLIDKTQGFLDDLDKGKSHFVPIPDPADAAKYRAYVYPKDPNTIYLGPGWFRGDSSGLYSRAGTLIHEMSHLFLGTKDRFGDPLKNYYRADTLFLPKGDRIRSADIWQLFLQGTPISKVLGAYTSGDDGSDPSSSSAPPDPGTYTPPARLYYDESIPKSKGDTYSYDTSKGPLSPPVTSPPPTPGTSSKPGSSTPDSTTAPTTATPAPPPPAGTPSGRTTLGFDESIPKGKGDTYTYNKNPRPSLTPVRPPGSGKPAKPGASSTPSGKRPPSDVLLDTVRKPPPFKGPTPKYKPNPLVGGSTPTDHKRMAKVKPSERGLTEGRPTSTSKPKSSVSDRMARSESSRSASPSRSPATASKKSAPTRTTASSGGSRESSSRSSSPARSGSASGSPARSGSSPGRGVASSGPTTRPGLSAPTSRVTKSSPSSPPTSSSFRSRDAMSKPDSGTAPATTAPKGVRMPLGVSPSTFRKATPAPALKKRILESSRSRGGSSPGRSTAARSVAPTRRSAPSRSTGTARRSAPARGTSPSRSTVSRSSPPARRAAPARYSPPRRPSTPTRSSRPRYLP